MTNVPPPPSSGFPLGKVLIVVGVVCVLVVVGLGILFITLVPKVVGELSVAQNAKARADMIALEKAAQDFAEVNAGAYPDTLQVLVVPDANGETFLGRSDLPLDPWGRAYVYEPPPAAGARPKLRTLGQDGRPGGEGLDADIESR